MPTTNDTRLLTASSPLLTVAPETNGRPRLAPGTALAAATDCVTLGAKFFAAVKRWPVHRWGMVNWMRAGEPEGLYQDQRQLACELQAAIRAARTLIPPLDDSVALARRAAAPWPTVTYAGRPYASAMAACLGFAEHVLYEFVWGSSPDDYEPPPGAVPVPWDESDPDIAGLDLRNFGWPFCMDFAGKHFAGLAVPDPTPLLVEARAEALKIDGEAGKALELAAGGFHCCGVLHKLTGRPYSLLAALLVAQDHRRTADQLRGDLNVGDETVEYPEQVVKDAAKNLRAALRVAWKKAGVSVYNPLPSTGRGADLTYALYLPDA